MGDSDERLPADPEGEGEKAGFTTVAADLCARVLLNGRVFGQFAMLMDELLAAAGRPRAEVEAAIAWGIEQAWLHHDTAYVTLRAAGIHVAKECSTSRAVSRGAEGGMVSLEPLKALLHECRLVH
jgi:hypothetical protein